MTKLYKVTDKNGKTGAAYNKELQWDVGVTHTAKGEGSMLCTDGVIHVYKDPFVAALMTPLRETGEADRLWEAKGDIVAGDALKYGVKTLTTLREIPIPSISPEKRMRIALLCALSVYQEENFVQWAHKWLSGEDRSAEGIAKAEAQAEKIRKAIWQSNLALISWSSSSPAAEWADPSMQAAEIAARAAEAATHVAMFYTSAARDEAEGKDTTGKWKGVESHTAVCVGRAASVRSIVLNLLPCVL